MKKGFAFKAGRVITLIILMGSLISLSSYAQDIIKMKSGKEMKVTILNEDAGYIKYRDFDDPSGPVYSVKKDLVESVKYKKGDQPLQTEVKNKGRQKTQANEFQLPGTQKHQLIMGKRAITLDGQPQTQRDIRSLMDDYPDVLAEYEKGRKETNFSNTCLMASLLVDLVGVLLESPKKTREENLKVGIPALSVSAGLIVTGIVLVIDGRKHIKKSISMYNTTVSKPGTYKIDFGIQKNGIMIAIRF